MFGRTFDEHYRRLEEVLERIHRSGLKLKPGKCHLFQTEVKFLGHKISDKGVSPDPDNIVKLVNWPAPRNVTEVRSFVGFATYYRRFVRNFANIAHPLTELTKKTMPFRWSEKCQDAFEILKKILIGPEIMAYPCQDGLYVLDTDASLVAIGAVLSQVQGDQEKVIAYGSKTLGKSEKNYCTTDRELLAIKFFLSYYKHYLLGRHFLVRTDHQPLRYLFSLKEPKDRTARWIEIMSAFDFAIEYRPGQKHGNADGISRCPLPSKCDCPDVASLEGLKCGPCRKCLRRAEVMSSDLRPVGQNAESDNTKGGDVAVTRVVRKKSEWSIVLSTIKLRKAQEADQDIKPLIDWIELGERPSSKEVESLTPSVRHYWLHWDLLQLREGVLHRKFIRKDNTGLHWQILVPKALQDQVMKHMHNSLLSGHLGRKKTREKILQRYYWHGVRTDTNIWVAKCDSCEAIKSPSKAARSPMGTLPVGAPMDRLGTDILGPLPETPRGNRYVLVVTDYFTKWCEIFAVPDQTAVTCAEKILNEVVARFGMPLSLHSDQGRNYEAHLFMELCKLLEIRKTRTSSGNLRCNGLTERFNRTLVRMIKAYLKGEQTNWDKYLGCLAGTVQDSTGLTPNLLMLGREVRLPVEVMYGTKTTSEGELNSYGEYVSQLRDRMQHAHDVARKHLEKSATRQKELYDVKVKLETYTPGSLVWYQTEMGQLKVAPKLRVPFEGPHLVTNAISESLYLIQLNKKGTRKVVHHNRLRPYRGNQKLRWAASALKKTKNRQ